MKNISKILTMIVAILIGFSTLSTNVAANEIIEENLVKHANNKPAPSKNTGWYMVDSDYYYYDADEKANITGVHILDGAQYLFDNEGKMIEELSRNGFQIVVERPATIEEFNNIDFGPHQEFANKLYEWLSATTYEWQAYLEEPFQDRQEANNFLNKFNKEVIKNPQFYLRAKYYDGPKIVVVEFIEKWRSYITSYDKMVEIANEIIVSKQLNTFDSIVAAIIDYSTSEMRYAFTLGQRGLYNAIFNKQTVCGGFTTFSEYLLSLFGFETDWIYGYVTDSDSAGYHSWNKVYYNGKTYYFDATFINSLSWTGGSNPRIDSYRLTETEFSRREMQDIY